MYELLMKAIVADRLREAERWRRMAAPRPPRTPLRCRIRRALTRLGHRPASPGQARQPDIRESLAGQLSTSSGADPYLLTLRSE